MTPSLALALLLAASGCSRAKVVVVEQPEPELGTSPQHDPLVEHEAVREAVRRYGEALRTRDPEAAAEWVVADTFAYYEDLRLAALRASREQLEGWDLMSVILILQIRASFDRSELEAVDGRALFERAVGEGLVGAEVEDIVLDEVWIDDAGEHAEIRIENQPVVWLRKADSEADHWRVDIPEMIRLLGPAMEDMARERVIADGKLRTALTFVELSSDAFIDIGVLEGPLEAASEDRPKSDE